MPLGLISVKETEEATDSYALNVNCINSWFYQGRSEYYFDTVREHVLVELLNFSTVSHHMVGFIVCRICSLMRQQE